MKKLFKTMKANICKAVDTAKKAVNNIITSVQMMQVNAKYALSNQRGDQNISTAVIILISIVIGALLLAGLYTLFEDTVLPTVTKKVQEMFDYKG